MEKISISIRIPAMNNSFDFIIPENLPAGDVMKLVLRIMSDTLDSGDSESLIFVDMDDGKALRKEYSLKKQGISDGARLMLI